MQSTARKCPKNKTYSKIHTYNKRGRVGKEGYLHVGYLECMSNMSENINKMSIALRVFSDTLL